MRTIDGIRLTVVGWCATARFPHCTLDLAPLFFSSARLCVDSRSPLSDIGNRGTVTQTAVGVGASERKDKSGTAPLIGTVSDANKPRLTNSQRAALYAECIKLASANKITVKNTWSLDLIDHMNDVLENEEIDDHAIAAAVGEDYDGPAPVAPVTSSNKGVVSLPPCLSCDVVWKING